MHSSFRLKSQEEIHVSLLKMELLSKEFRDGCSGEQPEIIEKIEIMKSACLYLSYHSDTKKAIKQMIFRPFLLWLYMIKMQYTMSFPESLSVFPYQSPEFFSSPASLFPVSETDLKY